MASQYWPQNHATGIPDPFSTSIPAGSVNTTHHTPTFTTLAHGGPPPHPSNSSSIGHALGFVAAAPMAPGNVSQASSPVSAFGEMELPNDDTSTPTKHLPLHGVPHNQLPASGNNWSHVSASRGWAHFNQLIQGNNVWNVHNYSHHLLRMGLHMDFLTNSLQVQGNENKNTKSPAFEIVTDKIPTSKLETLMDQLESTAEYVQHLVERRADFQPGPPAMNIDNRNGNNHNHETNMQEDQQQDDEYGQPDPQPSTNNIFLK
ncbi:hypothetical protein H0H81_005706 [Sphagnurus paluster]|uniref:Uncharacterized protein n=1 Tax=Sphagnurus paluster TaxID=117069 RepID=A0A9P7GII5_9AGAR|nr:hypothetical protein H0H81_005706 [Sphagnurus paluster]